MIKKIIFYLIIGILTIMSILSIFFIYALQSDLILYASEVNERNLNAYEQGQYQSKININQIWVDDLLKFGLTYQNVYYQNETYIMECKLK